MDDPFNALTPIGRPRRAREALDTASPKTDRRPAHLQLSRAEAKRQLRRSRSNQETGRKSSNAVLKHPRSARVGLLTQARALTMVSTLSEQFFASAQDGETRRESERKYATTSLGIVLDKWLLLSGRPTQILGFADVDAQRSGALELARRLALSAGEEQSA